MKNSNVIIAAHARFRRPCLSWSFGTMNSDHKIATLFLIALFVLPAAVQAKRIPAPVVEPLGYNGVRYTVPNDKGTKGYVVAWDAETGKQLWKKTVFRKCVCPFLEHDVQWVFIKQMRLEAGRLVIVDERDKAYSLDLKTRRVNKLKPQTGSHERPNTAGAVDAPVRLVFAVGHQQPLAIEQRR